MLPFCLGLIFLYTQAGTQVPDSLKKKALVDVQVTNTRNQPLKREQSILLR